MLVTFESLVCSISEHQFPVQSQTSINAHKTRHEWATNNIQARQINRQTAKMADMSLKKKADEGDVEKEVLLD